MHELSVHFFLDHAALEEGGIDDIVQILEMVRNDFFNLRERHDFLGNDDLGDFVVEIVDNLLETLPGDTLVCAHI